MPEAQRTRVPKAIGLGPHGRVLDHGGCGQARQRWRRNWRNSSRPGAPLLSRRARGAAAGRLASVARGLARRRLRSCPRLWRDGSRGRLRAVDGAANAHAARRPYCPTRWDAAARRHKPPFGTRRRLWPTDARRGAAGWQRCGLGGRALHLGLRPPACASSRHGARLARADLGMAAAAAPAPGVSIKSQLDALIGGESLSEAQAHEACSNIADGEAPSPAQMCSSSQRCFPGHPEPHAPVDPTV